MRATTLEKLTELQRNPSNIRNICILAHVDHGKTTLADTLVASNGIISQRMAGKLRYLDSRADEQLRGITMKSSAISLHFHDNEPQDYLINLIDSPGHIDFSSEVSTAVRLCDGAVVLVDVVEGVCPQTHAVLRQAWLENIKPVLVLNKLDRLITELRMSPQEAHVHLQQMLEQVNAITGELFTSDVIEKTANEKCGVGPKRQSSQEEDVVYDWSSGLEETDDSELYFSPDQGNVIFASAIDGWGFGIHHFAELYASKLGVNADVLRKTLWGDFYLENKTKRIKKGAQGKGKKPLFVNFILENLWAVYEAVLLKKDKDMTEKIVRSLNLKIPPRDARHADARVHLQAICNQWLPLSTAVLAMVVDKLPSPLSISSERVEKLLCSSTRRFDSLPPQTQQLKNAFLHCSPEVEAPVIVFVSKMFAVDKKSLPQNRARPMTQEELTGRRDLARQRHAQRMAASQDGADQAQTNAVSQDSEVDQLKLVEDQVDLVNERSADAHPASDNGTDQVFIAFARVFSGTVRPGQTLYVLGPKHDPQKALEALSLVDEDEAMKEMLQQPLDHMTRVKVKDVYLFMGRELESMAAIPAGNILGLGGMEDHILKSATVSNTVCCPAFTDMYFEASPIVRVALEPANPGDMRRLVHGLRLLNQSDPCVQVLVQATGEHVIIAAGEMHLQKCLDDLRDRYAKIDIIVSSPIVPFRESIIPAPEMDMVHELIQQPNHAAARTKKLYNDDGDEKKEEPAKKAGLVEMETPNRLCRIQIKATPLPDEVTRLLEGSEDLLRTLDQSFNARLAGRDDLLTVATLSQSTTELLREFRMKLEEAFKSGGDAWNGAVDQIWAFGPKRIGPNILLNRVPGYNRVSLWSLLDRSGNDSKLPLWHFDSSVVSGFQMATLSGPLCEEPLLGVCFCMEVWEMDKELITARERTISEALSEASLGTNDSECDCDISASAGVSVHCDSDLAGGCQTHSNEIECDGLSNSSAIIICDPHFSSEKEASASSPEALESTPTLPAVSCDKQAGSTMTKRRDPTSYGPFPGQLMSCVKEACRKAFQSQAQRLQWAMYTCVIQATTEALGRLYAVLGKRHGRILSEDMREGSSIFQIEAVLPVVESFGFAEEMRKRTSGLASPQLRFSHWEVIDVDPFWVPTTEEEYLHFGEKADSENIARKYMNSVRRRKGLKVNEKLVEFAEKQRTLSKNV